MTSPLQQLVIPPLGSICFPFLGQTSSIKIDAMAGNAGPVSVAGSPAPTHTRNDGTVEYGTAGYVLTPGLAPPAGRSGVMIYTGDPSAYCLSGRPGDGVSFVVS